jgi:tRNA modification GTPase
MLELKHELEPGRAVFGELVEPGGAGVPARLKAESDREVLSVEKPERTESPAPRTHSERIDEVIVTYFAKPHSYTTDDVIEISAHGSPVVLRHMVELALAAGARLAEPGEFTMRAFLNGRIDLTQAEAVRDLIESQTLYQAKVAAQQLEGALSQRLQPIKQKLVELIAVLEAGIDFAEDDVDVTPAVEIARRIRELEGPLAGLEASFARGRIVHDGLTLAIVGRPNVGKSSLFNRLVERDRAIVTAMPGTTRDLVTERISLDGIPLELVDTAGLRDAVEEVEQLGIARSRAALADAALVLVVLDATQPLNDEERRLLAAVRERPALVVINKTDLSAADQSEFRSMSPESNELGVQPTSALTGEGITALRERILSLATGGAAAEPGMLTNLRHQQAVHAGLEALEAAADANAHGIPHEMILIDLYRALWALDSLTGQTTPDDILNLIFTTFCIGK